MQEILVGSVFLPIMDFMADPVSMMMYVCLVIEGVEAKGHSHDSCKNSFALSKPCFSKEQNQVNGPIIQTQNSLH